MSGGGNGQFEWYVNNRSNTFIKTEKDQHEEDVTGLWIKPTFTADVLGMHAVMGTKCGTPECNPEIDYAEHPYILDIWGGAESDQCTSNAFWGCGPRHTKSKGEHASEPLAILPPIRSGRVYTSESFSFKYGKVEVRAKLPKGDWLWPAIWMMPEKIKYGTWPVSGEIDIVESRGNRKLMKKEGGDDIGVSQVGAALHWGPFFDENQFIKTHDTYNLKDGDLFSDKYHIFTLEWTPSGLQVYLDNDKEHKTYLDVKTNGTYPGKGPADPEDPTRDYKGYWDLSGLEWANRHNEDDGPSGLTNPWINGDADAPFDHNFYLVMNVAVGGTGVGGGYWPAESMSTPFDEGKTYEQPWGSADEERYTVHFDSPMRVFYRKDNRDEWLPSWQKDDPDDEIPEGQEDYYIGDHTAMKIDYIRVYEYTG